MMRREIFIILGIFIFAFCLRFYDLAYPDFMWMDETGHVPAAMNYIEKGQFEPDNWEHPPLRHILLYGFLKVFGDNPYGWRMRNVLFGALASVLTYLFAREVSGSRKTGLMAGLLLATDPLHIVMSRYTFEEVYGGVFFLAAIVLYLRHAGRSFVLFMSALMMGCALATKWYYVPGWFLIYLLILRENGSWRDIRNVIPITTTYIFVPLSIFIISYYPWFGRGYSLKDFIDFILNAYFLLQSLGLDTFNPELFFLSHFSPWEWFVSPVIVGQGTYLGPYNGEFILYMNNLPVWCLTIPSMVSMAVLAIRKRSMTIALPVLFFCATYGLYLFIRRPAFIYSALPLLPFVFTAIAYAVSELAGRFSPKLYYAALALMLTWSLFLYPLATAKKVPVSPYSFMLNKTNIKIQ